MSHLLPGEIYRLIDSNGEEKDLALFLEICPPYSLSWDSCKNPGLWHLRVLRRGKVEYLSTSDWTLLTMSSEG